MIWQLLLAGIVGMAVGIWAGVKLAEAKRRQDEWLRAWAEHMTDDCWQYANPNSSELEAAVAEMDGDGDNA